jgi:hypothetical protein
MDDLEHHLKNASRDVFLRLLETGLNSFLTRKKNKRGLSPLLFFMIFINDENFKCS